jgi:hypothetical protein
LGAEVNDNNEFSKKVLKRLGFSESKSGPFQSDNFGFSKVWQNTGLTLLSSAVVIFLCSGSGLDVRNLAFVRYLHQKFFNQHLFRA